MPLLAEPERTLLCLYFTTHFATPGNFLRHGSGDLCGYIGHGIAVPRQKHVLGFHHSLRHTAQTRTNDRLALSRGAGDNCQWLVLVSLGAVIRATFRRCLRFTKK